MAYLGMVYSYLCTVSVTNYSAENLNASFAFSNMLLHNP